MARKSRRFNPRFYFREVAICPEGGEIYPLPKEGKVTNCLRHHVKCDIHRIRIADDNPSWIKRLFGHKRLKNLYKELDRLQSELEEFKDEVRILNICNIGYEYCSTHIDPSPSDIKSFYQQHLDSERANRDNDRLLRDRIRELEETLERYYGRR